MKNGTRAICLMVGLLSPVAAWTAEQHPEGLAKHVPFLERRLHSRRWEVRYCLVGDLVDRSGESKRILETLVRDGHPGVANQALVRYLDTFVTVDKRLFDPKVYLGGALPPIEVPAAEFNKALVDYCLGRRKVDLKADGGDFGGPMQPSLRVLDPEKADDPGMYQSLTIVGMLGQPEDAPPLYPFLDTTNDYVAVGAARALLRLGDKTRAVEALVRITNEDPKNHLFYVTEALYALRELEHPEYRDIVSRVLSEIDKTEGIQPNWLNGFLVLASQVSDDAWNGGGERGPRTTSGAE